MTGAATGTGGTGWAGTRVLVAGATGFIGRAVAERLAGEGAALVLPARDPDAARSLFRARGVSAEVPAWDVMDAAAVADVLERARPAAVLDLVGYGVDPAERDPALAEAINARWPARLAELLAATRDPEWTGQALVHAGTALEYGAAGGDLDERRTEPRPTTPYGRTKLAGTRALAERAALEGLPAVTARLFTVYGPGERPGRLVPSLLEAARTDRPLELTEGLQARDFTWVGDVAEGLLRLAGVAGHETRGRGGSREADTAPLPGAVVNLATGRLLAVREFVRRAAAVLGIAPERLRFGALPTRPEEMRHEPVSVARLLRWTGWRPETGVEEGIRRTARRAAAEPSPPGA